jgi:hypothetical protein
LSKAYLGDNAALGRLGVGLSKAQLKSASFLEVQRTLNVNFAGQAAAAVEGYAGSMAKLTVAVDESKEAIGKGLLDAIAALSGSNDIDTFTVKMVNAAEKIGNAFRTVGDVIGLLNPNASVKVGGKFLRKSDMNAPRLSPATSRAILLRQEVTQIKTGVSLRKQENAALKAKTAVDALRDKFDLERIGLTAALNAATDEETKLRLKAQLAILDNNEALAKKFLAEMAAAEAAKKLAEAMAASAANLEAAFRATIARLAIYDPVRNIAPGQGGGMSNVPSTPFIGTPFGQAGSTNATNATPVNVTLELAPNAGEFGQLIYNSFLINQKNGLAQTVNGGIG